MRTRFRRMIAALGAAALLAVVGCAPDTADSASDPSARGKAVFDRNCASCHGAEREGTTAGPPLTGDAVTSARIEQAVTKGIDDTPDWPAMPPLLAIGEADRAALVAYLRS